MPTITTIFDVERDRDTLVATPLRGTSESDRAQLSDEVEVMLDLLATGRATNVVIDFNRTECFGCTAVAFFFLKLWTAAQKQGGQMAFCCVSDMEREFLRIAKLDDLWPICSSRDEALAVVRGDVPEPIMAAQRSASQEFDAVGEASDESFPASDAPSWTPVTSVGGHHDEPHS